MTIPAEYRLLALSFGRRIGCHDPESPAAMELTEVLERRLARLDGGPPISYAYRAAMDLAVDTADAVLSEREAAGQALAPFDATLEPALLAGLPVRPYRLRAEDHMGRVLDVRNVLARTTAEAFRLARQGTQPAGLHAWTFTATAEAA